MSCWTIGAGRGTARLRGRGGTPGVSLTGPVGWDGPAGSAGESAPRSGRVERALLGMQAGVEPAPRTGPRDRLDPAGQRVPPEQQAGRTRQLAGLDRPLLAVG